jgi:hypothetical protein
MQRQMLGQILVANGVVQQKDLEEALQRQIIFGGRLGTNLMEMGLLPEETLLKVLSFQQKVPYAEARHFENISPHVIASVPHELVKKHDIIPIDREKTRLTLAMTDPSRLDIIDEVAFRSGCTVRPVIATELRIMQALDRYYGINRDVRFIHVPSAPTRHAPPATASHPNEMVLAPEEIVEVEEPAPPSAPFALDETSRRLNAAADREQIADAVVEAAVRVLDDVLLFILKGNEAQGWREGGKVKVADGIANWSVKLQPTHLLSTIQESRSLFRSGGRESYIANPWLAVVTPNPPAEVFAHPILIKNRAIAALLGFSRSRPLTAEEADFLVRLVRKATLAFEILVLKSKLTAI